MKAQELTSRGFTKSHTLGEYTHYTHPQLPFLVGLKCTGRKLVVNFEGRYWSPPYPASPTRLTSLLQAFQP